jgi:hypothetical protein
MFRQEEKPMQNAHLRMGILEYDRHTEKKIATRIRMRITQYVGESENAHLISIFGNDSDVGAITAAVYEQARFKVTFPTGNRRDVTLGEGATCYRGGLSIPGRKHAVRHMIAVSEELRGLKSLSRTFALRPKPQEIWTNLVHWHGLPALPEWAEVMIRALEEHNRISPLDGIGCFPVMITASAEELLEWLEAGVRGGELPFPEKNGPIRWPRTSLCDVLRPQTDEIEQAA